MEDLLQWFLPNVGPILTALGLLFTVKTLKANHDWNRRNYATNLVAEWNNKTFAHRKAIECLKPGLVDLNKQREPIEITKMDASTIYCSKPTDTQDWELRFHFIELLNHFEAIAVAYRNGVGDRIIIEESLGNSLIRWHEILVNFIKTVNEHRGYEAWEPYTNLVNYWERKPFKVRPYTEDLNHFIR